MAALFKNASALRVQEYTTQQKEHTLSLMLPHTPEDRAESITLG